MQLRPRRFGAPPPTAVLLSIAFISFTLAPAFGAVGNTPPSASSSFGRPPSGEIPILYNDHTVYAKPDILKQRRVLAAFIKNHQIYVPLRSMFEQMGAIVTASADGKRFTATKPGSTVSVALGSDVVTVNGETRPLDVPPILYRGVVLVPVRVISEALGAYVLWVPSKRVVVVRYIPIVAAASPAPIGPAPPAAPTAAPTLPPVVEIPYHGFIAAGFATGRNYNEFSAGSWCPNNTYVASAAFVVNNSPLAVKFDYRQDAYVTAINLQDAFGNYFTQFSTIDGGVSAVPVFLARQNTIDGRLEYKLADPHVYVGVGYIRTSTNYGYPHLTGVGFGVEKLPDLKPGLGFFGSAFYYPSARGTYTVNNPASSNFGNSYRQQYRILKYDAGLAFTLRHSPIYAYGGVSGDRYEARSNAPISQTHGGPYLGLGLKL
ncbi:MAG: copper amine oxidase N-terminal domain-containing protein [Candidatus Eremiobacteraeota bacterium]|nr:copper amine oxidase N-terminal domain-containing protein [Candidatus Eremiobacteraeota bacterium]